ncbi:protein strawberry notch-like [Drosophila pseudoobscura]|uniref:Protein strawberry notch-like n=1 Tax=Drosophila pseudoobscura pseudoobscura TaxID=46245 RepID=A0A6I8V2U0_DROPS|nr:protein strawberry notch [Drosophila pseudoobscura]
MEGTDQKSDNWEAPRCCPPGMKSSKPILSVPNYKPTLDSQRHGVPKTRITSVTNDFGKEIPLSVVTGADGLIKEFTILPSRKGTATVGGVTALPQERESFTFEEISAVMEDEKPYYLMHIVHSEPQVGDALAPDKALQDEEVDYEENRVAESFVMYEPSKLQLSEPHSTMALVEKTILSSVALPDISYDLKLPGSSPGCLSTQQLEAVLQACQTHEGVLPCGERAGFLLGDGPGVGKGRTIAGIIYDNYLKGRQRALWVSVSNVLKCDVERDLKDIRGSKCECEEIKVVMLDTLNFWRISSEENDKFKAGIVFCTYTSLLAMSEKLDGKYDNRFQQVSSWLGKGFDGVIVFDECDNARNLTRDNVSVLLKLQKQLPSARMVYVLATEPSDPKKMIFMTRLGLWGPGTGCPKFDNFANEMQNRSPASMKMLCMDMKLRGTYIARQLRFKNVGVRIEEVAMTTEFRKTYDHAAKLWAEINMKWQAACRLLRVDPYTQQKIWDEFWSSHQQFFRFLCLAGKVENALNLARDAIDHGKAVVISLQSTEESWTLEYLKGHKGKLKEPVSTLTVIMRLFVEKYFPAPKLKDFNRLINMAVINTSQSKRHRLNSDEDDENVESDESDMEKADSDKPMQERILVHLHDYLRSKQNKEKDTSGDITDYDVACCIYMRYQMLCKIDFLGRRLPANTMDKLKARLGGHKAVAEITTRRGGIVSIKQVYQYMPRCSSAAHRDQVNFMEHQSFMADSKKVAIIAETTAMGISLHSDQTVANQRQRVHIILELPSSLDLAIQQLGRTHRSNQVNTPEYVFVVADLVGERRMATTVAARLKALGALIKDKTLSSDDPDLDQISINNIHGPSSLYHVIQQMAGQRSIDPSEIPDTYKGDFLADCEVALGDVGVLNVETGENGVEIYSVAKDSSNVDRFINRLRGCCVEMQNVIFKFFIDNMYGSIAQMKRSGRFNIGILDLTAHQVSVKSFRQLQFTKMFTNGSETTQLHTLQVERGMTFSAAMTMFRRRARKRYEGFYQLKEKKRDKMVAILCLEVKSSFHLVTGPKDVQMEIYRPHIGRQVRIENLASISSRYVRVKPKTARKYWQEQYDVCLNTCSHIFWNRTCHFPDDCMDGKRIRTYNVLSGRVLPFWHRITNILEKNRHRIQMISAKTDVGQNIVGIAVPNSVYKIIYIDLSSDVGKVELLDSTKD